MTLVRTVFSMTCNMRRSAFIAALFASCCMPAFAQSTNTVTIAFGDGDEITGEVVQITDFDIELLTTIGSFTIPREGATCTGAACPVVVRQITAGLPVIVLSARDGSAQFMGNLLEITDGQYVIVTEAGELRLNISDVNCAGEACLDVEVDAFEFGGPVALVSGTTTIEGTLTGFDESGYFLDVDVLGALRVTRDFVCSGDGCPPTN